METLQQLYQWSTTFKSTEKFPVLFVGHGSPMNAIEDNEFTQSWSFIGKTLPKPNAILVISAHWLTHGTYVTATENPKTIHDFGGFPKELYEVQYPAKGQPELALTTTQLITSTHVGLDHEWGLDHGTWSVVRNMYPEASIPVLQLSIDYDQPASYHYRLSSQLASLRKKGVLILGSGNMIHNLRMLDWSNLHKEDYGFDWAKDLNAIFKQKIEIFDSKSLIDYQQLSSSALLAVPTPDHYYPLLYAMALSDASDTVTFFNDKMVGGSLNMTSVIWS